MKIAFVTDSGCGKNIRELEEDGIYCLPLQVSYDNKSLQDQEDITIDQVYELMKVGKVLSTSLPALGRIEELFQQLKDAGYDMVFTVPICAGLSGTINAMSVSAANIGIAFDHVDCHVTAVVQEYMIKLAKQLFEEGKSIPEIKEILESVVDSTNTILIPDDLQSLTRSGRLTPFAATLGGFLKIKPILEVNKRTNGKIDVVNKVRTMHRAMSVVIDDMRKAHVDDSYMITVAHADAEEEAQYYMSKIKEAFPNAKHQIIKLVSVVGVHTGRGCQALQYFKMIR